MRKKTILYVEDSGVEREIICGLLNSERVEVITASDAGEAIELARRFKPDLILLDLHLPDMDGQTLAENLRGIPHLESVPIVVLSASIDEGELEKALPYCDSCIGKPVDMDRFPLRVLELLEAKTPGDEEQSHEREAVGIGAAEAGEAADALETLERLRATLSHDMRTPLTVIISYATTVAREKAGPLNDMQKEMLETLVEYGFKMDDLISELVRIARKTLERYDYPPKQGIA